MSRQSINIDDNIPSIIIRCGRRIKQGGNDLKVNIPVSPLLTSTEVNSIEHYLNVHLKMNDLILLKRLMKSSFNINELISTKQILNSINQRLIQRNPNMISHVKKASESPSEGDHLAALTTMQYSKEIILGLGDQYTEFSEKALEKVEELNKLIPDLIKTVKKPSVFNKISAQPLADLKSALNTASGLHLIKKGHQFDYMTQKPRYFRRFLKTSNTTEDFMLTSYNDAKTLSRLLKNGKIYSNGMIGLGVILGVSDVVQTAHEGKNWKKKAAEVTGENAGAFVGASYAASFMSRALIAAGFTSVERHAY